MKSSTLNRLIDLRDANATNHEDTSYIARMVATIQRCASSRENKAIMTYLLENDLISLFRIENGCLIAR